MNKTPKSNKQYPKTVEEAVNQLLSTMSTKDKELLKNTSEENLITNSHFEFGTYIRNKFGLWGRNKELLKSCGCVHPDDASSVIIRMLWEKLHEK